MTSPTRELARNRRASHDYEILETYEAGLVLHGSEIKALRQKQVSIGEAYVLIDQQGRAVLKGCHIAAYRSSRQESQQQDRERFLLLHKQQLLQLRSWVQQKRLTLIPLAIYLKNGWAKVTIAVGKGRRHHDKRRRLQQRTQQREITTAQGTFAD